LTRELSNKAPKLIVNRKGAYQDGRAVAPSNALAVVGKSRLQHKFTRAFLAKRGDLS
jgi:hypothetical protein